jgi:hypothetical protein
MRTPTFTGFLTLTDRALNAARTAIAEDVGGERVFNEAARSAIRPTARQRSRPDAENFGGEVSF